MVARSVIPVSVPEVCGVSGQRDRAFRILEMKKMTSPAKAASQAAPDVERVIDKSDPRWVRLREIIQKYSLQTGDFILASGRHSKFLFQLRQTTMLPEGSRLLGEIIVDYMDRKGVNCVGGLAVGAVPLVSAVSTMSSVKNSPKDAFFVRKEVKTHGGKELINGFVTDGAQVLMIDDVGTTGGSVIKAIEGLKTEFPNCRTDLALVIVDRQEGAAENLREKGVKLAAIFQKEDFEIG